MKLQCITLATLLAASMHSYADDKLKVSLTDSAWDGKKVPSGQQCSKFDGKGSSPLLKIKNIPEGANAIVMEYSDRTYKPMDLGGHGKFGYRIKSGKSIVKVPSVKGHTFDLPKNFFLIEAQRAPSWDTAGAYLPPCSGGNGHDYYLTVKAVNEVDGGIRAVLSQTEIELGKY